jgi:hypothetical protein
LGITSRRGYELAAAERIRVAEGSPMGRGQEVVARAELGAGAGDAEPEPDVAFEPDPDVDGVDSDVGLPLEPGSDLPFEMDSRGFERLSVR